MLNLFFTDHLEGFLAERYHVITSTHYSASSRSLHCASH